MFSKTDIRTHISEINKHEQLFQQMIKINNLISIWQTIFYNEISVCANYSTHC